MIEFLGAGGIAAAIATAFGTTLWFIDRRMPKAKSPQETRDSEVVSLRGSVEFQAKQITAMEKDIEELRKEVRENSIKAHKLYIAIQNFLIDYPHHGDWWAKKLKEIEL